MALSKYGKQALGVVALCTTLGVNAAPRLGSSDECLAYADMALMARAAAVEGIDKDAISRAIGHAYSITTPRAAQIAALVIDAAYKDKRRPFDFGQMFLQTCLGNQGNVDAILGVSVSADQPRWN